MSAEQGLTLQTTTTPLYKEKEKLEVVQRTALHLSTQINPHGASRGELQQHHHALSPAKRVHWET